MLYSVETLLVNKNKINILLFYFIRKKRIAYVTITRRKIIANVSRDNIENLKKRDRKVKYAYKY